MSSPLPFLERTTPERLVAALPALPPLARVLSRLQRLLSDHNSDLDDVAKLIQLDAALTTRVIQISNSAWYKRGDACKTIQEAVNRLGFREVNQLVGVIAASAIVAKPLAVYERDAMAMWQESISCAFAAELLAERLSEDTATAYTMGLLHSIGWLAIDKHVVANVPNFKPLADEGFPLDHSGAEFALLGFSQAEVAACMLKKWEFAPAIFEPIRAQYEPLDAEEPYDHAASILHGARLLRSVVCQKMPGDEMNEDDEILASIRLSRDDLLELLPALQTRITRAQQIMKVAGT
ncbi:MAG: HDOD domain-containing protein [Opitutae bacterium]|nr:HDOD domain-containing protein [Opitutae bacterium]